MLNKFTPFLIAILFIGLGLLLLYRSVLGTGDLTIIEGKVKDKQVEQISSRKGKAKYGLTFTLDNHSGKLGVFGGSDRSSSTELAALIDTTQIYQFYIDPTVVASNGIDLGVRQIKLNNTTIYKESTAFNLLGGLFFMLLGGVSLFVLNKYSKR